MVSGMLSRRSRDGCFELLSGAVFSILLGSCVRTTPFQQDAERNDLNAENQSRLLAKTPPRPYTFVAIGDTHDAYDDTAAAARSINRMADVEFVAHAGDITDRGLLQEFNWAQDSFDELQMPLLMSIGNHDAVSDGKSIYREMYGPYDYSFLWGGMKWVFFNSNTLEFGPEVPDREWLRQEIGDRQGQSGIVVVTHHPPVGADDLPGGDNSAFYDELLREQAITLFVHGHIDEFRLYTRHGTPVLQCSTFQNRRTFTRVRVDGTALSFERCQLDVCEPVQPELER